MFKTAVRLSRPIPPTLASYKYFLGFQSRWNDNDQYAHFNNVKYIEYVDSIVNEYLINHGKLIPSERINPIGLVVSSSFNYAASLSYPNPILAALSVKKLGKSSVTYDVALFAATDTATSELGRGRFAGEGVSANSDWTSQLKVPENATAAAWGTFVHVFATSDGSQQSTPIPEWTRLALEKLL